MVESIDNRDHLISKIEERTRADISSLEKEHETRLKAVEQTFKERRSEELSRLKESHKKNREKITKQEESSLALYKEKSTVMAQSRLYDRVVKALEDLLSSKGKERDSFYNSLAKRVETVSDKKIVSFRVPKGVALKGRKVIDDLDDIAIIGVIDEREEIEITLKGLLSEKSVKVGKLIKEELF